MIAYHDDISILWHWRGSVLPLSCLHALPGTVLAVVIALVKQYAPDAQEAWSFGSGFTTSSSLWNAMTSVIGILIAFRVRQALERFWEGTSLLHQMKGEWFDAASCLVTFSRQAKLQGKLKEVENFRHTFVRLMSLMHGSALDEISGNDEITFDVIDIQGLDTKTLHVIKECRKRNNFSKVEALLHFIQVLVTANHDSGVLTIPPPILTRVYQTLSRGFVNLLNARKIKDTLFPFPFVQVIKVLLIVHSFFTPLLMSEIANNTKVWAALFTFLPLFGLNALNIIAWQLEMPFGADSNDLPLHAFQQEMNETLLMLVDEGTDHMPELSSDAERELQKFSMCSETSVHYSGHSSTRSNNRTVERDSFFTARSRCDLGSETQTRTRAARAPDDGTGSMGTAASLRSGTTVASTALHKSCENSIDDRDAIARQRSTEAETPKDGNLHVSADRRVADCFLSLESESGHHIAPEMSHTPRKPKLPRHHGPLGFLSECTQSLCTSLDDHIAFMIADLQCLRKKIVEALIEFNKIPTVPCEFNRLGIELETPTGAGHSPVGIEIGVPAVSPRASPRAPRGKTIA